MPYPSILPCPPPSIIVQWLIECPPHSVAWLYNTVFCCVVGGIGSPPVLLGRKAPTNQPDISLSLEEKVQSICGFRCSRHTSYNAPLNSISSLRFLSALAAVRMGPQRSLSASSCSLSLALWSRDAWTHIMINSELHLYLAASFHTVFLTGSSVRRRRISSTSAGVR